MGTPRLDDVAERLVAKLGDPWVFALAGERPRISGDDIVLELATNEWHASRPSPQMWITPVIDLPCERMPPQLTLGMRAQRMQEKVRAFLPRVSAWRTQALDEQPSQRDRAAWLDQMAALLDPYRSPFKGTLLARRVQLSCDLDGQCEVSFQRLTRRQAEALIRALVEVPA